MPLHEDLQHALGSSYTVARELSGGGMSRVFVARDETLQRDIVVKVLPPELLGGVNLSRFSREIQLAAGLQHPHIVPVHASGEMDGLPYFIMPFIEGESLRDRLAHGPLPVAETIGILRDLARALAYAHERHVIHRDIKPDNVLLSGGSAAVTDFGIARALDAAKRADTGAEAAGSSTRLTSIGMSIGTPAYMAPEQAAGDPDTDHRADIYSFGCLAYELLAGRPPFAGKTPQKLLAAHMAESPQPITELRADTPLALAALVMRCLAKDPEERPQSARELTSVLDSVTTSGTSEAMPAILLGGRGMFRKALALYAAAFVAVAILAKAALVAIGLPDWVFPGALVVMALGLPLILFTAYVQYATRRAVLQTPAHTPGGTPALHTGTMATLALKASPHVSWHRTLVSGAWGIGAFVALVGGYMALRAVGIGPAGSLLASGAIAENERVLVADFPSPASDTTLGPLVTEAFRTALGQSRAVQVVQQSDMQQALHQMLRPAGTRVDFDVAREMATRDGIRAVITGTIIGIGGKYSLAAQLKSPQSGEVLASFSAGASSQSELLPAIDKLARDVRARFGESLRRVQATPPLGQVTTASLEALRLYIAALQAENAEGASEHVIALLYEATAVDTGFAMAYRKIAWLTQAVNSTAAAEAVEKAFAHRNRLTDVEAALVTGAYYQFGRHTDRAKAIEAYERLLAFQPQNSTALYGLGLEYLEIGQPEKAREPLRRAVQVSNPMAPSFYYLQIAYLAAGQFDSARIVNAAGLKRFPSYPILTFWPLMEAVARQQFDSFPALAARILDKSGANVYTRDIVLANEAHAALAQGRIADAERVAAEQARLDIALRKPNSPARVASGNAAWRIAVLSDTAGAMKMLDDTLARYAFDSTGGFSNPFSDTYESVVTAYALGGLADRARAVLERWERLHRTLSGRYDERRRATMKAAIATASGDAAEAIAQNRIVMRTTPLNSRAARLARSFDLAGNADSAVFYFQKYVDGTSWERAYDDALFLAGSYKRLGELYEARNDRQRALWAYAKFVDLWKHADPRLQPQVSDVKARIARLSIAPRIVKRA